MGGLPLEPPSEGTPQGTPPRTEPHARDTSETVEIVIRRAVEFARQSESECVGTVHMLFAILELYGRTFDPELYRRGTFPRRDLRPSAHPLEQLVAPLSRPLGDSHGRAGAPRRL